MRFDDDVIYESACYVPGLRTLASFSILENESGECIVQLLRPEAPLANFFGPILGIKELGLISKWIGKAVEVSISDGGLCSNSLPGWIEKQITICVDEPKQKSQEKKPIPIIKSGWVYLVEGQEQCFKIGQTSNLEKRIWDQLSPRMPYPLKLIHSIRADDCIALESRIHAIFDDKSLNGEWFKLDAADISKFKEIKNELEN